MPLLMRLKLVVDDIIVVVVVVVVAVDHVYVVVVYVVYAVCWLGDDGCCGYAMFSWLLRMGARVGICRLLCCSL